jgi:hypothetical protein
MTIEGSSKPWCWCGKYNHVINRELVQVIKPDCIEKYGGCGHCPDVTEIDIENHSSPITDPNYKSGVYILKWGPAYKIGMSCYNIYERIRDLKDTYNSLIPMPPFWIDVAHIIFTGRPYTLERKLHTEYQHCHLRGEWFELTNKELEKIKRDYPRNS